MCWRLSQLTRMKVSTLVLLLKLMLLNVGQADNSVTLTAEQCTPQLTHISYGDTVGDVVIMWSTLGQCSTNVEYSTGPWHWNASTPGDSRLFNDPANQDGLQVIHRVKLRNLSPGTLYFYKPISSGYFAGPFYFQTPPANPTETQLMIISDVKTSSSAIPALLQEALTGKYAALLHTGNIAMNLSSNNGTNGDRYLKEMENAFKAVPYMTSPGPAEVDGDTFTSYLHRFSMPQAEWPMTLDKMWYSIDIGPVHLISYSTEVFFTSGGKYDAMQHDWLIKDLKLANQNRETAPWIVAFGNKPMYCSYEDPDLTCNQKVSKVKSELEDIFYHYGADIIIQSYGIAYERSFPMYKGFQVTDNYTNPMGPVHIMNSGISSSEMEYNFTSPAPLWSAFRNTNDSILSYGRLCVVNASLVFYEQVNAKDGSLIDSFNITQDKHGQFSTAKLPPNITAEINKEIVDSGGKPGVLNIEEVGAADNKSKISALLDQDNRTRLIIGVSCAAFIIIIVIIIIFVKSMRKKRKVTRRWEQMDINYGKKFYSKAPDKDEDNDFEIDMSDGTEPTRKLLNTED